MLTTKKAALAALALFASAGIASVAHADDWKNVPHAYLVREGTTITPEDVRGMQGPLLDHCVSVAWEVIPSRDRAILGHAFSNGITLGAGEAAGTAGQMSVVGARHFVAHAIPGAGLVGFLVGIFQGGLQGNTLTNERFRSATDSCLRAAGGGLYSLAPSDADKILQTGVPMIAHVPGTADNWREKPEPSRTQSTPDSDQPPARRILPGAYIDPQ